MPWILPSEKLGIKLPPGFTLEEEEDFLFLKSGKKFLRNFLGVPIPKKLKKERGSILKLKRRG